MISDGVLQKWFQRIINLEKRVGGVAASTTNLATTVGGLPGVDTLAPAAPVSVAIASSTYQNTSGEQLAQAQVSWPAVTTNSDGSACTDLSGYLVSWKISSGTVWSGETFVAAGTTSVIFQGFTLGQTIDARVRAVDAVGNKSGYTTVTGIALTTDTTPPNQPSTPTVTGVLAGIRVVWDGKDNLAAAMPADFDHYEVHQSTTTGFTPSAATLVDSLPTAGGASTIPLNDYGTTHYVKLVAYDRSSNASTPSTQATGTPTRAVDADLLAATITNRVMGANSIATANIQDAAILTAKIADLQVVTAKIASLAVTDAKIGDCSITKLTAGTLSADLTVSARIKTANTGQRVELNSTGLQCYDSGGTLTVNIAAGAATINAGTITGALYQTAASMTTGGLVQGVKIGSAVTVINPVGTATPALLFHSGQSTETQPAGFTEYAHSTGATFYILGPKVASGGLQPIIELASSPTVGGDHNPGYIRTTGVNTTVWGGNFQADSINIPSDSGGGSFQGTINSSGEYILTDTSANVRASLKQASAQISPTGLLTLSPGSGVRMPTIGPLAIGGTVLAVTAQTSGTFQIGYNSSSRRYKTHVADAVIDLDALTQLRVVTYKPKDNPDDVYTHMGLIAEEVDQIPSMRWLVGYMPDENGQARPEAIHYERLALALLAAHRSTQERLSALEAA